MKEQERISQRTLVVDDNKDSADSIAALLEMLGHEALAVYDGIEAFKALETFKPDVLLLDIGLPGENGYEIATRIRKELKLKDLMIVAMTGYSRDSDRALSKEAGFNAHLVKPVDFDVLEKLLETRAV